MATRCLLTFNESPGVRQNLTDTLGIHDDNHRRISGPKREDLAVLVPAIMRGRGRLEGVDEGRGGRN